MSQETLKMSFKERSRLRVMGRLERGEILLKEAAHEMRVSLRTAVRIAKRYRKEGDEGLVHKSRDRPSNRACPKETRTKVIEIYKKKYPDFGPTLACEKLEECEGINICRESLRRWLIAESLWRVGRKKRVHRKNRKRRSRFGEMLQIDGSDHEWLEGRAKRSVLMVMVDDATGRCVLHMARGETTEAALVLLRKWVKKYGVPEAIYADKCRVYFTEKYLQNPAQRDDPTVFSKFMSVVRRLGTDMIVAHSAQAKGRVERLNRSLQDRLVKEMRLAGVRTIGEANAMLDTFSEKYNAQFEKTPVDPLNAHRLGPASAEEWEQFFCLEETRKVARDNTVVKGASLWQILKQEGGPMPGQRVTYRQPLGSSGYWLFAGRRLEVKELGPR